MMECKELSQLQHSFLIDSAPGLLQGDLAHSFPAMSSTDERKIPKIVLKIGGFKSENVTNNESGSATTIFSTRAADFVKDFHKMEVLGSNSVDLPSLLKRINQSAYKSLENVLELMGRMNDIERKKTLYQVLSRLRDIFIKLQIVIEWTKVAQEHLALKIVRHNATLAKDNISRLIGGISHFSNNLITRKQTSPSFEAYKSLLSSSHRVPSYFAPSIAALAPAKCDPMSETEKNLWISTLEALLWNEISRNIVNVPKRDAAFISITEGKAKILFLNLFEFEFTLVPSADHSSSAWFILDVKVDSMKEIFKNSLTGIFQFKYNNKSTYDSDYFRIIVEDCSKYIELFYYEKMFSQFSFFSNSRGKSICSFQRSPQGDWFKFRPWFFATYEAVCISFSNESKFKVESGNLPLESSIFKPSLSFKENECQLIFEKLFVQIYMSKLEQFLLEQKTLGILKNVVLKTTSIVSIEFFESYSMIVRVDPLSKKFKFDFFEKSTCITEDLVDSDKLTTALISFDSQLFLEIVSKIKKEIFTRVFTRNHSDVTLVNCDEIPSSSGFCLRLVDEASAALSINISAFDNSLQVKFWAISVAFQKGFMNINYKELKELDSIIHAVPSNEVELAELLEAQKTVLLKSVTKNSFESIIKSIGTDGEFLDTNNFKVFSFGLPSCIDSVFVSSSETQNVLGRIELNQRSNLKQPSFQLGPVDQNNVKTLYKALRNSILLLSIWEHMNLLEPDTIAVENLHPIHLKFKKENTSLSLSNEGEVQIVMDGQRSQEVESFIESDNFSIYELIDTIVEVRSRKFDRSNNNNEGSPDLTWLSDSFM